MPFKAAIPYGSCFPRTTVMTTDVVAFHAAQAHTICVNNHVGSAVAWSEGKACRWRLKTACASPVHVRVQCMCKSITCASPVRVQANAEVVRSAMKSPQASVRQCAMRVFKLLGGDTLPEPSHAPAAASAVAAPDLMGNLLGEEDAPAAAPQDYLGEYRRV